MKIQIKIIVKFSLICCEPIQGANITSGDSMIPPFTRKNPEIG